MTAKLLGRSRPDLIPVIRARLAAEWGCRVSDLNIAGVTDRVVSETVRA